MTKMKGITCCGDCGYYNWKKHKCTRATDEGDACSKFYADCPLPDVVPVQEPQDDDADFMTHIICEICDYAVANGMEPNDTLNTISDNIKALLKVSTFNNWKKVRA